MAPTAPKDRYYRADFFAQLFQKSGFFGVPANGFLLWLTRVIFGTLFGTPVAVRRYCGMKPGARGFVYLTLFRGQTNTHPTNAHKLFRNRGC